MAHQLLGLMELAVARQLLGLMEQLVEELVQLPVVQKFDMVMGTQLVQVVKLELGKNLFAEKMEQEWVQEVEVGWVQEVEVEQVQVAEVERVQVAEVEQVGVDCPELVEI